MSVWAVPSIGASFSVVDAFAPLGFPRFVLRYVRRHSWRLIRASWSCKFINDHLSAVLLSVVSALLDLFCGLCALLATSTVQAIRFILGLAAGSPLFL